ncbi:MAG: hypothetical protein NVS9B15_20940 [Acidobacteriaceae bacterium]
MHLRVLAAALLLFGCSAPCRAQGTQLWKQSRSEDFEKGTGHGVALRSDGVLTLAPATKPIATSPSTYLWDIASDNRGAVLVAAGSPARLYSVTLDGKSTVLFEGKELQTQCVTVARDGTIYFATSPDGKVYRIRSGSGSPAQVFFDPKTKYIWALALDSSGNLYAATGDGGQLFRIDPNGNGSVFFKSDESHIRSLAFDSTGNLIAGSDSSGLIYRIDNKGQAFVLFSAPKREVTSLAVSVSGDIYAASVGEKRGSVVAKGASSTAGGSEVDKISADGSSLRLWSSKEDLAYALAFDGAQNLLIGTGNKGTVYSIPRNSSGGEFTTLITLSASQVTSFASFPGRGLIAATSNLGKLTLISNDPPESGTFESDTFDAKTFAKWGRVEVRGQGKYELAVRTGNVDNPDRNWSPWAKADLSGRSAPDVPGARFAQWRATLYPGALLDSVSLNYRQKNMAPVIDELTVNITPRSAPKGEAAATAPAPGEINVKWTAHDDNNDDLRYSVLYRAADAKRWISLRDNLKEKQSNLDPTLFPDGDYQIRVIASDIASHSPEDALTGERLSPTFSVESTPPRIDNLQAVFDNGAIHISFRAIDSYSPIKRAEFSIDAGDWQAVEPVGEISDALIETYDFVALPKPPTQRLEEEPPTPASAGKRRRKKVVAVTPNAPEEHLVVVRAYDRFDNVSTAKTTVNNAGNSR